MIRHLQFIYRNVITSIAFLPAIIGLLFFFLSLASLYLEFSAIGNLIKENLDNLLVKGNDNARQVLGTLIGGIISLMVFSFSMVMVVVSQASSNFTPRAIPGILTDKKNQFILGFYVGTIIYCLVLILNVEPGEGNEASPKIGILLAMISGIICLALFTYFIHLIGNRIQVGTIIATAAHDATHLITKAHKKRKKQATVVLMPPDTTHWYPLKSVQDGYLSEVDEQRLKEICRRHQLQVELLHLIGTFLLKDQVVCKLNQDLLKNDKRQDAILSCFYFFRNPYGENSYLHGMNQISEIAVKALSPGINDPGTAAISLDHLSSILCGWLQFRPASLVHDEQQTVRIIRKEHSLRELLFNFIAPIYHYGKEDVKIRVKLLNLYACLLRCAPADEAATIRAYLSEEMLRIEEDISTPSQREMLLKQFSAMQMQPAG